MSGLLEEAMPNAPMTPETSGDTPIPRNRPIMISGRFTFLPDLLMKPWFAMAFRAGHGERAVVSDPVSS